MAGWIAIGALWLVVLALCAIVLALARQIGVLHERLLPVGALKLPQSLKVGEPAPLLDVVTLQGKAIQLGGRHSVDRLVMFVSPTCPVCKSLLPALRSIGRRERPPIQVFLASDGSRLEHLDFVAANGLDEFEYVLSEPLGLAFGANKLPHAVLLDRDGIVRATGLVNSREHLDSLFEARQRGVATLQEYLQTREHVMISKREIGHG